MLPELIEFQFQFHSENVRKKLLVYELISLSLECDQ